MELAGVVAVAGVVVVVSEKPAMLAGDAVVLFEFATYMKLVDDVQFVVHWFIFGKNPHPVSPTETGANIRPRAQIVFLNLDIIESPGGLFCRRQGRLL